MNYFISGILFGIGMGVGRMTCNLVTNIIYYISDRKEINTPKMKMGFIK